MISLRIENLLLNKTDENHSTDLFKEGSIFKGEVLEILDDVILIHIEGRGIVQATSDIDIKSSLGSQVSFLVKSNIDGRVEIKPLLREKSLNINLPDKENNPVLKILNSFNIKSDEVTIDLVKKLTSYKAVINEKNIMEGVKLVEKLIELTSLDKNDKVILLTNENLNQEELLEGSRGVKDNSDKEIGEFKKTSIKNLLVVDKNSYPEKDNLKLLIETFIGEEEVANYKELNKIFSFLIKNEMRASLNNIKNLRELVDDPIEFSKDFLKLNKLIDKVKEEDTLGQLKKFPLNISIEKDNVEDNGEVLRKLQEIIGRTEEESSLGWKIKKEINELQDKLDFLREMDQDLSFLFLPLNYGEKDLEGILTLLKEKKNKQDMEDRINIFINLNTHNLGNIKISCRANINSLWIKMSIQEEDMGLFQQGEKGLIHKIESMGYQVEKIEYLTGEKLSIINTIATDPSPMYFLDVKV